MKSLRPMPTPLQIMQSKSLEELLRIKSNMPGRIKAAGSILNPERREKALKRLEEESTMLTAVLGPRLSKAS